MTNDMFSIILPALVAGLMVAMTHAPLGLAVLKRGIIFIDLAIAQIAGLGLLFAVEVWHVEPGLMQQMFALLAALSAAVFFLLCEKKIPQYQEAIIGCSYILAASLAVLLVAHNPHGSEALQDLLSGQILFVSWPDVLHHAPVYVGVLSGWLLFKSLRQGVGFYFLFALAITSSVQLVGVYVVFASLIVPALAVTLYRNKIRMAWLCGMLSMLTGMLLASQWDLPAGPLIVVSYILMAILFVSVRVLNRKFR